MIVYEERMEVKFSHSLLLELAIHYKLIEKVNKG
jgi:hypothetical protein